MTARGLFMLKRCVFVIGAMLLAHPVLAQPAAPARAAAAAIPTVEDRISRPEEDRRLLPALLGRAHRLDAARDPAVRHRVPVLDRPVGGARLERPRARSRPGRQGRIVQFQRVGPRVMLVQGNQSFRSSSQNPLERKSVEDSFAKSVLWGFTVAAESNGARAGRRHRLPAARRAWRRRRPASRHLPRRPHAQRVLPAQHQELPEEHRRST